MRGFDWRAWPIRLAKLWRSSLQLRTVAITVVLSALAVTLIGSYMSVSVGTNLFDSRRDQLLAAAGNATVSAQSVFDAAVEQLEAADPEVTMQVAGGQVAQAASSPGGTEFAIVLTPRQGSSSAFPGIASRPDFDYRTVVTDALRAEVAESISTEVGARMFWQSVEISEDSRAPGLVVASPLRSQNADYQLFLLFDLSDVQQTLDFVQQTLVIGGLALVVLIGAVTYIVVRLVVGPVQVAAETSEKFAAGQLEARIPERGEDVIATLARSFNGMADSLQKQITRLAALSQVQQRFVSDVSHELRTPLTTIRLAGDVLYDQRESFPPATARTAELLHTQVERFEGLLADLLEMSRYDAGAAEMESEPTNLVRLVEDAIDSMSSLAESKGSEIRLVAPGGYFEADVDPRRIRRILRNLLGNAIDHGEGKPIVVYVDSDSDAVAIAVRDYGIGMPQAAVGRVFDRFWRADPSRQRTTGGSGLGLAISVEDAALHDGWLEVWSREGEGSCFRLTIPRVRGTELRSSPIDLPPVDEVPVAEVVHE